MKKLWIGIVAGVGLTLAVQATVVSFVGADVDGTTGQQNTTPGAADTTWGGTTLLIDSIGATQADLKFALSQYAHYHKAAQINKAGYIYAGGGGSTTQFDRQDPPQPKVDAVSGFTQIIAFDTAAFGIEDLLSLSVDISPRYTGETLAFRWFVEAGGNAYVSGVVDADVVGTETHTLADATIEWFDFDDTLNLEASLAALTSAGTLTLSDVAYTGIIATETWDSGTTNWRGPKITNFSAEAIPEPATIGMLGLGALVTLFVRRRIMI